MNMIANQAHGQIVGYARTSTTDQKAGLEAQLRDLRDVGCVKLFQKEISAVAAKRPELERTLDYVREGDTLVETKPDRLARSSADLLTIARTLEGKGGVLRILSMAVDKSTQTGKLILTVLGGIAEFERDLILEREREGIAKAKERRQIQRPETDRSCKGNRRAAPKAGRSDRKRHRSAARHRSRQRVPDAS